MLEPKQAQLQKARIYHQILDITNGCDVTAKTVNLKLLELVLVFDTYLIQNNSDFTNRLSVEHTKQKLW